MKNTLSSMKKFLKYVGIVLYAIYTIFVISLPIIGLIIVL